ncbi:MAG TPA: hypothetical protein VI197_00920 [Polyangiaceae bacterium]
MTRPAWPLSSVPVLAVITAFSGCGDDEGVPVSRSVESNNATVGSGGLVDPDGGQPTANFGRPCERAEDCGVDLLCLTSASHTLSQGGPPGGLCTVACNHDPSICGMHAADARCVNFGSTSYCLEVCDYGSTRTGAFDAAKCHGRTDFACTPSWVSTGQACTSAEECVSGERCDGTCLRDVPTCMPRCNSDTDCAGEYCDPRSGECVAGLPSGRRLAERCNVSMEQDTCRGSCGMIERSEGGRCDEACTLGAYPSCGVIPEPPNVGCAIPVNTKAGFGDLGYCALLCDCTQDCPDQMVCVVAELDYLQRPGFCKSPEAGDRIRSSCGTGGAGGEAGAANGGGTGNTSTSTSTSTSAGAGGAGPGLATGIGGSFSQAGAPAEGGAAGATDAYGGTFGL